jgi:hypothetical protein
MRPRTQSTINELPLIFRALAGLRFLVVLRLEGVQVVFEHNPNVIGFAAAMDGGELLKRLIHRLRHAEQKGSREHLSLTCVAHITPIYNDLPEFASVCIARGISLWGQAVHEVYVKQKPGLAAGPCELVDDLLSG